MTKDQLLAQLGLSRHFEGGYFRETFRTDARNQVGTARGPRAAMTAIFYMLTRDSPIDAFHTKHSDGITFYQMGDPITYHLIHPDGRHESIALGPDLAAGQQLQLAVAGGTWKAAELEAGAFGLVSEVVAPGWEMADMILATRAQLLTRFPQHAQLLERLGAG